jgi:hypothetical protein
MVTYSVSPDVIAQSEDGKVLLFHQSKARVLILNSTAAFLWNQCESGLEADAIPDLLVDHYELNDDDGSLDRAIELARLQLERLVKAGFIEREPAVAEGC